MCFLLVLLDMDTARQTETSMAYPDAAENVKYAWRARSTVKEITNTWNSVEDFSRPRSASLFRASICKVLKQIHPDLHISTEGSRVVEDMLLQTFHTIAMNAFKDIGSALLHDLIARHCGPQWRAGGNQPQDGPRAAMRRTLWFH